MLMLRQDRGISALIQHREPPPTTYLLDNPLTITPKWTDTSTPASSAKVPTAIKVMGRIPLVYVSSFPSVYNECTISYKDSAAEQEI